MSEAFIATINSISSVATIALMVCCLVLVIGILSKDKGRLFRFFSDKALMLLFIVSFGSVVMSLVYSNLIGFTPCVLCWYQRIFMYSTAVISGVALAKRYGHEIWAYILSLSILGTAIALFHVISQGLGKELIPCPATGPSCLQRLVDGFGFIDIPVMSLTAFIFVILIIVNKKRFS